MNAVRATGIWILAPLALACWDEPAFASAPLTEITEITIEVVDETGNSVRGAAIDLYRIRRRGTSLREATGYSGSDGRITITETDDGLPFRPGVYGVIVGEMVGKGEFARPCTAKQLTYIYLGPGASTEIKVPSPEFLDLDICPTDIDLELITAVFERGDPSHYELLVAAFDEESRAFDQTTDQLRRATEEFRQANDIPHLYSSEEVESFIKTAQESDVKPSFDRRQVLRDYAIYLDLLKSGEDVSRHQRENRNQMPAFPEAAREETAATTAYPFTLSPYVIGLGTYARVKSADAASTAAGQAIKDCDRDAYLAARSDFDTALRGLSVGTIFVDPVNIEPEVDYALRNLSESRRDDLKPDLMGNAPVPYKLERIRWHMESLDNLGKTDAASDLDDLYLKIVNQWIFLRVGQLHFNFPDYPEDCGDQSSLIPATGSNRFYASADAGARYFDLPNFEYVRFSNFATQQVFVDPVLDFDNNDVGMEVGGELGYICYEEPSVGRKDWIALQLNYAEVDNDSSIGQIRRNNSDIEFFGPAGGGFTLLGAPNVVLNNISYSNDYSRIGVNLRGYSDFPVDGFTLTPFGGIGYGHIDLDTSLALNAIGNLAVNVMRDDSINSDEIGLTAGVYVSRRLDRNFTIYGGGQGTLAYSNADGSSTLTRNTGGGPVPESANFSESQATLKAGAGLGLRYDLTGYISLGLEGSYDFSNGAPVVEYSAQPNQPADIDFKDVHSWAIGGKFTISFSP